MALDSTPGLTTTESYISVADFEARCDLIGYDHSTYSTADKENACRRGTEWLEGRYLRLWPGEVVTAGQALHFPARQVYDIYGNLIDYTVIPIPVPIQRAVTEAIWRELQFPNSLTPDYVRNKQLKRKVTGPLEKEYFDPLGPEDLEPFLTAVRNHLSPLVDPNASQGALTNEVYAMAGNKSR